MPKGEKGKKSRSKSQQRLFGMVAAYKSGKLKLDSLPQSLSDKIKSVADGERKKTGDKRRKTKGITKKAAKELASTKHKGLPETVKESHTKRYKDFVNESNTINDNPLDIAKEVYDIIKDTHTTGVPVKERHIKDTLKGFGYEERDDDGYLYDKIVSELVNLGIDINIQEAKGGNYMDALKGGESENMTIQDIANKHNINVKYFDIILPSAIKIEMEHTDDPEVAERIALDHLSETPLYYDEEEGLPEMEEELEEMGEEEVNDIVNLVLKEDELDNDIIQTLGEVSKKVKKFDEL